VALYRSNGEIEKKTVKILMIWGTNVEVTWELNAGDEVILTDLTNYDASKNTLKIQ
jgi:hypothetical protein